MSVTEPPRPSALPSDEGLREDASSIAPAERPRRRHYQYEPLRDPKSDIRVLKLLPSGEPDEVHCSLEICSLDDKPFYVAVSYEWGEPDPQVDIKVDGKPFRIRHNLWLFLSYLHNKKSNHVRYDHFRLWADAICIDQTNLTEKGTQVQMMSRIFREAGSVFAWLGYTTRLHTKATFRFIKEASLLRQVTLPNLVNDYGRWYREFVPEDITSCHIYYGSLLEMWKGILQLSRVSYWSRRWIVQELVLPREVVVLLDDEELPWSAIEAIFEILNFNKHRPTFKELTEVFFELLQTIPWKLCSHRGLVGPVARHSNPFEPLLQSFRQTVCTVPYDKVYAFLGLIENGNSIEVDYGCSMIELFCKVASFGGMACPRANFLGSLATELGLYRELDEKHVAEPKSDVGPFVKCSPNLSSLVRIVHVDRALEMLSGEFAGVKDKDSREEGCPLAILEDTIRTTKDLVESHQIFDTNLCHSYVETKCASLRKREDEVSNYEDNGSIHSRVIYSRSLASGVSTEWTIIVCEDGSIGSSCPETLPGDFLCHMGQRQWLILREYEGLFAVVGTAFVEISKSRVPEIIQSADYHSLTDGGNYYHSLLRHYKDVQESVRKWNFACTWVEQTIPAMKAPGEFVGVGTAFAEDGGRAQVCQPASVNCRESAAPAKDQEVGVEASFMPETLPVSSIDIHFNGWELVQLAQKGQSVSGERQWHPSELFSPACLEQG